MSFFKNLFGGQQEHAVMDWREFTEYFAQTVAEQAQAQTEIEWGEDLEQTTVHINLPNGFQAQAYLGNRYAHYRQNPDNLAQIMDETVQSIAQIGNDAATAAAREHIFPTIKPTAYLNEIAELYRQKGDSLEENLCFRPLAGDMAVVYMMDTGPSYRTLSPDEWAQWQITDEVELHDLAIENLEHFIGETEGLGYRHTENGLYRIYLNDVLDASLILLLERILEMAQLDFAPYPVFAVPTRDLLLVCAADNQAALAQMQQWIDEQWQDDSAYQISACRYCLKNGQITLFDTH